MELSIFAAVEKTKITTAVKRHLVEKKKWNVASYFLFIAMSWVLNRLIHSKVDNSFITQLVAMARAFCAVIIYNQTFFISFSRLKKTKVTFIINLFFLLHPFQKCLNT